MVIAGEKQSQMKKINGGILQGSVLGPLSFVIKINQVSSPQATSYSGDVINISRKRRNGNVHGRYTRPS
jgi:hypothetical protein